MCRTITPEAERVPCDRCGKCRNPTDGWEHGWPNYGAITLGYNSVIDWYLTGDSMASRDWLTDGHPALTSFGFQEVTFNWGSFKVDNQKYRMCIDCQRKMIKMIGAFFKIPELAKAKDKSANALASHVGEPHG